MPLTAIGNTPLPAASKWAFTTRRVERADVQGLRAEVSNAVSGDLVLGQVTRLGQHRRVQLSSGRHSELYPGDFVVAVCGARYAPDQFEARAKLDPAGADLIAGGGLFGETRLAHEQMSAPTRIKPLGLLTDREGSVINIARYALPDRSMPGGVTVVLVVGTSMNAGKTTAAVSFAHGLGRAGYRVAGIKATGTGAFGDFNAFLDAGVPLVSDFTDAGMASTYGQPLSRIERGFESLVADAAAKGADVMVVELADGLYQQETARLLQDSRIRAVADGILFAASDAVSAVGGVAQLRAMGLEPFALSGRFTCSPMASAEAEAKVGLPVLTRSALCDPEAVSRVTPSWLPSARTEQREVA